MTSSESDEGEYALMDVREINFEDVAAEAAAMDAAALATEVGGAPDE